jgi:hypothetical protein
MRLSMSQAIEVLSVLMIFTGLSNEEALWINTAVAVNLDLHHHKHLVANLIKFVD